MHVLQIAPPWFSVPPTTYGGIELVVAQLTEGLIRAGHEVTLFASGGSVTSARLESVFSEPPSTRLGDPWPDLEHVIAAYANASSYDIVHDHSGIIGPALGAMMSRSAGMPPVIHTLHGPWHHDADQVYGALLKASPQGLRLVAISKDQASRAPAGVFIEDVVYNGVAVEDFPFRATPRGTSGTLAFVGRAHPDKGPDTALRVAKALGRRLRMAIKVNEPAEHQYFDEVLRPMFAGQDVEVLPNASHKDKIAMMAQADALLVPLAWNEPFGLVMAEAMACGTPVIAYAMGSAPELVAHGVTGFLVPPGDLSAFADAIDEVGQIDPSACLERVQRLFSAHTMVDGYLEVYEKAIARDALRQVLEIPK